MPTSARPASTEVGRRGRLPGVRRDRSRLSVMVGGDEAVDGSRRRAPAGAGSSIGGGTGLTGTSRKTTAGRPSPAPGGGDCRIGADMGDVIGGCLTGAGVIGRGAADGGLGAIGGAGAGFAVSTPGTAGSSAP